MMNLSKDNIHVFIVRIWREPREIQDTAPKWRGVIEHVPGDKRQYLEDLDGIAVFIRPYMQQMGIKSPAGWHMKAWLERLRVYLKIKG